MSDDPKITFIDSITEIEREIWNKIINSSYPFIQYDFLLALEQSGATGFESGWQPHHLVVKVNDHVKAVMPLYIKEHSYGEYVFDHTWADAYYRNGLDYYPKLVSSIPFTPVVGQRIYCHQSVDRKVVVNHVIQAIRQLCEEKKYSSWHLLFSFESEISDCESFDCLTRVGFQYHWFNQNKDNQHYDSFDDFLQICKSKPRKNIRRERRLVEQQNIRIKHYQGNDIPESLWHQLFTFYQATYLKRSGHAGYLNKAFFEYIATYMNNHTLIISAETHQNIVAASLFFKDDKTLYGRYWGCLQEFDCLHFELCYYQSIEYCIKHQLDKLDAGAQGEHKVSRGFKPVKTYSSHWIAHQDFSNAIELFVKEEAKQIESVLPVLAQKLPFKS